MVENLEKVPIDENSFNKLVYDERKKEILRKLTARFVGSRRPYDDLIPDKGSAWELLESFTTLTY